MGNTEVRLVHPPFNNSTTLRRDASRFESLRYKHNIPKLNPTTINHPLLQSEKNIYCTAVPLMFAELLVECKHLPLAALVCRAAALEYQSSSHTNIQSSAECRRWRARGGRD